MNNTESREYIQYAVAVVIGFIVGAGIISIWNAKSGNVTRSQTATTTTEQAGADTQAAPVSATGVSIDSQVPGSRVRVAHVELPKIGWVVVHEIVNGKIGNALGATMRDLGASDNVEVVLLRPMKASGTYAVGLYTDNGNRIFERRADTPLGGENGDPALTPIVLAQ
jgi:hypothetical protein